MSRADGPMGSPSPPPPTGAPVHVGIDGIVEGRVGDAAALAQAIAALDRAGFGTFHCEQTGGRYSLLPRDTELAGAGRGEDVQAEFLQQLGALAAATAPGSLESTLRCTLVYADQVVETLFAVRAGVITPISRTRAPRPDELAGAAVAGPARAFGLRRREVAILWPILVLVGALLAWRTGLVDRVLAARAEQIAVDAGPFGTLLATTVARSWGNYEVEVRRGATFPADPKALAALRDGAAALTERAACELVGNGGELWLELRDAQDHVLDTVGVTLQPLLADREAVARATLPGRIDAARFVLALAEPHKR